MKAPAPWDLNERQAGGIGFRVRAGWPIRDYTIRDVVLQALWCIGGGGLPADLMHPLYQLRLVAVYPLEERPAPQPPATRSPAVQPRTASGRSPPLICLLFF